MDKLEIKLVGDNTFSVKPRKMEKSEIAPFICFVVVGLMALLFMVSVMDSQWLILLAVIVPLLMFQKLTIDRRVRAAAYKDYLSGFQEHQLHRAIREANDLKLDGNTLRAIKDYLSMGSKVN